MLAVRQIEAQDYRPLEALVVDDGTNRPGCSKDVTANCFSRAVEYRLDWGNATRPRPLARVVWQFEFPMQLSRDTWADIMARDVYNNCGGSVYKLPSGNYLVAFTAMDQLADAARQHNTSAPRAAYAWELALDTPGARGPTVRTTFKLPISHEDAGEQNGYRVVPWHSIAGESSSAPWSL